MLFDQVFEGNAHFFLNNARVIDVTTDAEKFGSLIPLTTEPRKPTGTSSANCRGDRDSLDVCNSGGTTEEANVCREGGFQPRFSLFALEGLDQGGFFAAYIGASTTMDVNVEIVSGTAGVFTDETGLVCLIDRLLQMSGFLEEFTTDVDIGSVRVHATTSHETTFDKLMRVSTENFTVLASAGLPLVGIYDEITRSIETLLAIANMFSRCGIPWIFFPARFIHKTPFETRRETCTATTTKSGVLDVLDDPRIAFEKYVLCTMPVTA